MKRLHKKRFMNKSLSELHNEFMRECEFSRKLSTDTLRGYESAYKLFVKLMGEDIQLAMLTPEFMTEFFRRIDQRERKVGNSKVVNGVKKSTIATYRSKLAKFFGWLEKKGHIKQNPFKEMEFPDVRYEDKKFLKREEVERILNAVSFNIEWSNSFVKKRCLAILFLGLYCGLRKGEILGQRLIDVDFDRNQITVRAESSKSKRERVIPLNRMVKQHLKDYIEERKKRKLLCEYLMVSNSGDRRFTGHGHKHLMNRLVDASGLRFHTHQLRHTFAINMLNSGCDIAKLQQLLGHRDIRMTAAYLRCIPTSAMRVDVERLMLDNLV